MESPVQRPVPLLSIGLCATALALTLLGPASSTASPAPADPETTDEAPAKPAPPASTTKTDEATIERLVRFANGTDAATIVERHGAKLVREPGRSGFALVRAAPHAMIDLLHDPAVMSSQRNATTTGSRTSPRATATATSR